MADSETIRRAATVMKILRLMQDPAMDAVAVKLNMQPTHDELLNASAWHSAFEWAADTSKTVFEIAAELDAGRKSRG